MTDARIRQDVVDALDFDPAIDAKGIGVSVDGAVVTLSGHVPSYMQKVLAQEAAIGVKDVRGVAVELEVRLPSSSKREDDEIAHRALNIIAWSANAGEAIQVVVENGRVTLSGAVDWNYQRLEAERAVRRLSGVTGVANNILLRTPVSTADVRERIAKALERTAALEANAIEIKVADSTVTLSGKVRSWRDRQAAENAAWASPGVAHVCDELVLQ